MASPAPSVSRDDLAKYHCQGAHPRRLGQKCGCLLARGAFSGIVELECPRCGLMSSVTRTVAQCLEEASEIQSRLLRRT